MIPTVFLVTFVIILWINICHGFCIRYPCLKSFALVESPKEFILKEMQLTRSKSRNIRLNIVNSPDDLNISQSLPNKTEVYNSQRQTTSTNSIFIGIRNLISGKGWKGKEFLTKEKMAKLGLNVLLAYGFVSNFSYVTCVIISWIAHGRKYGKSPLAPGQWKYFLLIYSGFWAANNVIRPARFSFSLLISPVFERIINFFVQKGKLKKTTATALVVFLVNVIGTTSYLVFGLFFATRLAKVPLLP